MLICVKPCGTYSLPVSYAVECQWCTCKAESLSVDAPRHASSATEQELGACMYKCCAFAWLARFFSFFDISFVFVLFLSVCLHATTTAFAIPDAASRPDYIVPRTKRIVKSRGFYNPLCADNSLDYRI